MNQVLIVRDSYIFNPTKLWYSCTVVETKPTTNENKFQIKVIPPRSSRNYPSGLFTNPTLIGVNKLRDKEIQNYCLAEGSSNPVVVDPIDVTISGIWTGIIEYDQKAAEISIVASVTSDNLVGWFTFNDQKIIISGRINTKSHSTVVDLYFSEGKKLRAMNGDFEREEGFLVLDVNNTEAHFNMKILETAGTSFPKDVIISGDYMGFYQKNNSDIEFSLKILANQMGLISGKGTENRRDFSIYGLHDAKTHHLFVVRPNGSDDYITYVGDLEGDDAVFISGQWRDRNNNGNFTFIKNM